VSCAREFAAARCAQVEAQLAQAERDNQWLMANFCEVHQEICLCSSGPCGLCAAKQEQSFSAQLESNIKFLNERVEAAESEVTKLKEALRPAKDLTYMTLEDCTRTLDVYLANTKDPNLWVFKVAQQCVEAIRKTTLIKAASREGDNESA
jgi:hypothetical protein